MISAASGFGPVFQSVLNLVFPPGCAACGEATLNHGALCGGCWGQVDFLQHGCVLCGAPVIGGHADHQGARCDACLADPPNWTAGTAALAYSGAARRIVLAFKHGDRLDLAPTLGAWMVRSLPAQLRAADMVVPVPLHTTRLMTRGYNQAAALGAVVARESGIAWHRDLLIRARRTKPLKGLGREERQRMVQGAFRLRPEQPDITGRTILVVDDVMTSGATLRAATHTLQQAGAKKVFVAVLARVARPV